jgi:hypothetical protein
MLGANAAAVVDIPVQGVTRRTEWCKQRHAYIMKQGESASEQPMLGPDGQPLDAAAANNTASLASLTKQQVRCLSAARAAS